MYQKNCKVRLRPVSCVGFDRAQTRRFLVRLLCMFCVATLRHTLYKSTLKGRHVYAAPYVSSVWLAPSLIFLSR